MDKETKESKIDQGAFARSWYKTRNIGKAMLAAGYSEYQSRKGRAGLPEALLAIVDGRAIVEMDAEALIEKADGMSEENVRKLIKGMLIDAVEKKDNAGVQAAKLASDLLCPPDRDDPIGASEARRIVELAERLFPAGFHCPRCGYAHDGQDIPGAKERQAWLDKRELAIQARERILGLKHEPLAVPDPPAGPIADCSTGHHAWETIEQSGGWKVRKCTRCGQTNLPEDNIDRTTVIVEPS